SRVRYSLMDTGSRWLFSLRKKSISIEAPIMNEDTQLLDAVDRWVERSVRPAVREFDHADRYPARIVEEMRELGLFGATISQDYGGLGLPAATYARIV